MPSAVGVSDSVPRRPVSAGARRFVVVSRDGSRLSTSEPVSALGQSLAWRPSGATLASVQRLPNKLQVVFFEKNGLRHGEFTLPFPPRGAHVSRRGRAASRRRPVAGITSCPHLLWVSIILYR